MNIQVFFPEGHMGTNIRTWARFRGLRILRVKRFGKVVKSFRPRACVATVQIRLDLAAAEGRKDERI